MSYNVIHTHVMLPVIGKYSTCNYVEYIICGILVYEIYYNILSLL
jgi:hypothetical protein